MLFLIPLNSTPEKDTVVNISTFNPKTMLNRSQPLSVVDISAFESSPGNSEHLAGYRYSLLMNVDTMEKFQRTGKNYSYVSITNY